MKNFYLNLLAGVSLLSVVALSSPVQAVDPEKNEETAITMISAQQKIKPTQDATIFPLEDLPPHVLVNVAEKLDVVSLIRLIQVNKGFLKNILNRGYNLRLSLPINIDSSWTTSAEFINEFTTQFQEDLNVAGLLAFYHISPKTESIEYTRFKMKHADQKYNLNLTRENVLALRANPHGEHAGRHLAFADLNRANLTGAYLKYADLRFADLSGVILIGAKLESADLTGAGLKWANLSGAILTGAILTGAKLESADLSGAILTGANLIAAIMTPEQKADYASRGAIVD